MISDFYNNNKEPPPPSPTPFYQILFLKDVIIHTIVVKVFQNQFKKYVSLLHNCL